MINGKQEKTEIQIENPVTEEIRNGNLYYSNRFERKSSSFKP